MTCPVYGRSHSWCRQPTDTRSPCPALNTLANHGYLPRHGRNIGFSNLVRALREGYNLSLPLALFLTIGGFILLRRSPPATLYEIGKHGRIEHDASLVHEDTPPGQVYAPIEVKPDLVDLLIRDATGAGEAEGKGFESKKRQQVKELKTLMDARGVARARLRREKQSPPLDAVHAEIARGEMALVLGMMGIKDGANAGVPVEQVREWIGEERLPTGWQPTHVLGLIKTVGLAKAIRNAMQEQRKMEPIGEQRSKS